MVPEGVITGSPFCIIQFVTSVVDGYDAEICFPVQKDFGEISELGRLLPGMEVLSLSHEGSVETLGESYRTLYAWAADRGMISDEFCREIYREPGEVGEIEIQFVVHPWDQLLEDHLVRVLGKEKARNVARDRELLTVSSSLEERFAWVRDAVTELEDTAGEEVCYEVLSRCAHVFPTEQISKLREVYLAEEEQTGDMLAAVDAVIEFMGNDPGWGEKPRRQGKAIYSSKKPRDPAGYEKAEDPEEKRKAYCFCPLIRENLDGGMPSTFCYCGAGWFRQQWEGAIGRPVKVEIVRSILKGDELCEFAVLLPVDYSSGISFFSPISPS